MATTSAFSTSSAHNGAYIVYINGIEVPTKSVSLRYGVWQIPEMVIEMVADPVLTRMGAEDRIQVVVFFLDDLSPDGNAQFRLFGEGEITGWGYQNTPSGRSINFTVVNQMAVMTQLFVQFLTTLDDMFGHATYAGSGIADEGVPGSELVFPFSLFEQGILDAPQTDQTDQTDASAQQQSTPGGVPGTDLTQSASSIVRPFDFLYNVVKNMIGAGVPNIQRTVPSSNFFARWARLTNFHNRFVASPFFDEVVDNANVFPVLRALQDTSAIDVLAKNLMPQVQNAGALWDMIQLVYQTVFMEVAMIPSMPLVTVDLKSSLIETTDFNSHKLAASGNTYVSAIPMDSRKLKPKRIPNYFAKPQVLFGLPPTCNVIFPSEIKLYAYDENYATQPTRLYFSDETIPKLLKMQSAGVGGTVQNVLTTGYPPEADAAQQARGTKFNGKNFLLFPEEFYKGPVMDRRTIPPWLFFLQQSALAPKPFGPNPDSADGSAAMPPPPAQTGAATVQQSVQMSTSTMSVPFEVGKPSPTTGKRVFPSAVERLRTPNPADGRKLGVSQLAALSGIPEDFVLAWINVESGGDNGQKATSNLNERGYFQIMGPHVENGKAIPLSGTEAARIGLTLDDTGSDPNDPTPRLTTDPDFSLTSGIKLIQYYRGRANTFLQQHSLTWPDGDVWRVTKQFHALPGALLGTPSQAGALQIATQALGRAPTSWEEMFLTVQGNMPESFFRTIRQATAVGGVVPNTSGTMATTDGVMQAPPAVAAPATPTDASASGDGDGTVAPNQADILARANDESETVYQLYAKYEFFRERYSKRTGSAVLTWNPFVVPGFPAAIFDQRATRVDIFCYVTTVQQKMSHRGGRETSLSFIYGRTLQEMFDLLKKEFSEGAAVSGSAPQEPVRDIRKVVQNFGQAETYYQKLFFGGQRLFNKDAAFDWRRVIGYAPDRDGDPPQRIFIDGPDEAAQDNATAANATIAKITPLRAQAQATLDQINVVLSQANAQLAELTTSSPDDTSSPDQTAIDQLTAAVTSNAQQAIQLQTAIDGFDAQLNDALAVLQSPDTSSTAQVVHNVVGDREIVPLPGMEKYFNDYDSAMAFNWRPICSLDEYVIFYDSVAEDPIPAFGDARSVGAQYYGRIRRLTALTPDTVLPTGADGLSATTAPSTSATDQGPEDTSDPSSQSALPAAQIPGLHVLTFTDVALSLFKTANGKLPQTRNDWDKILLAYRNNVYTVKAPRT